MGFHYRLGDPEAALKKFMDERKKGGIEGGHEKPSLEMFSSDKWPAYQSVAIHLSHEPTQVQLAFMKERAMLFPDHWMATLPSYRSKEAPIAIEGVDLLEITIEEKLTPVE